MPRRLDPATAKVRLDAKAKAETALSLRVRSWTWDAIAREVGYTSGSTAYTAVQRYLEKVPPSPDVEDMRTIENLKLDELERKAFEVLDRHHVVVSNGKIMGRLTGRIRRDETGEFMYREVGNRVLPVYEVEELGDDDPALRAITTIRQLMERRARLNGLDRPVKIEIDDGAVDAEIVEIVEALVVQDQGLPVPVLMELEAGDDDGD